MACKSINRCSSSSSQMKWKYDVFVSFRGEDIRYNFIDHLFAAFVRKGIVAFRDDTTLEKGKSIFVELMQAIQASHVFIVVFSKNYAASTWCLDELARIVDCSKVTCQTTLPVFYDVTPSEVRKQSGDYGKALIGHEIIFKDDLDVVKRWRESLKHVAGLSGWDLQNKPQHGEIEKIIEKVRSILDCKSIEGIPSSQRWKHDMKMETYKTISSSQRRWKHDMKYDVFVSFRGDDIQNHFIDNLFAAFKRKGVVTFRDDTTLAKGKSMSVELMQAIRGSQVLIVVFSKNYAASTLCLEELAHIVDCVKITEQTALPVFYDVIPSEVRKQSGGYGKALTEHEKRSEGDLEMVQRWREALAHVANLSGWDVRNKIEYQEIETIIKEVINMLSSNIFSSLSSNLVGMHSRIEKLEELMVMDSDDDVRVVGVCGMGGIGKTTLLKVLYDKISHKYDACCFIDDVGKIYKDYGPIGIQKQLLCQTLNEANQEIWNLFHGTSLIRTRLRHLRSLIVLDNVDQVEQLEKSAVSREWLYPGSRIVIASRGKNILQDYGVDGIYDVQLLTFDESLHLFCRTAFKSAVIMKDYEMMTNKVLSYANGLPLAIKVLGSFLFGRDIFEWRCALARLEDNPNKDVMDVLRISFDHLREMAKKIFLDIACFFNHQFEVRVKRILGSCGLDPDYGLRILNLSSLITIHDGKIHMHDLLEDLGRQIIQEKAPNEPRKWSRLWRFEHFHSVMFEKMPMDNLEAIQLEHVSRMTTLRAEALSKMSRLRLLMISYTKFSGSLSFISNELRYLEWEKYPFTYLPSSFKLAKLVELILPYSSIKQLWEGIKTLHNLRLIDLRHSKSLIKTPDFRSIPNLEKLNLEGCTKLVQINSSIGWLTQLVELNLKNCTSLMSLPNSIFSLSSLEVLNLYGCSKSFNNQLLQKERYTGHLKKVDISETTTLQYQSRYSVHKRLLLPFHCFRSRRHGSSVGLFPCFPCLRELDLSFCNLLKIPDAIGCLYYLEILNLGGNNFVGLPSSIKELPRLGNLNLQHCKELEYLFEDLYNVLPARTEPVCGNYKPGLYIFNCPKLVEMKSWSNMAVSWMIQVIKESSLPYPCVEVVIPGTQIPMWFNNQSVGDSIRIDEPFSFLDDSDWIGVSFCVAFVAYERDHPINLSCRKGHFEIECKFIHDCLSFSRFIPIVMARDLFEFELVHLYLVHFSREEFITILDYLTNGRSDGLDGIKLDVVMHIPAPRHWQHDFQLGVDLDVVSCGLRRVFYQELELEEMKPIMTNGGWTLSRITAS